MKIIGMAERKGIYEGNDYHNIVFHCVRQFESDNSAGNECKIVKVKASVLEESLGKRLTQKEMFTLVGKSSIEFYYNEFGSVNRVQIGDTAQTAS